MVFGGERKESKSLILSYDEGSNDEESEEDSSSLGGSKAARSRLRNDGFAKHKISYNLPNVDDLFGDYCNGKMKVSRKKRLFKMKGFFQKVQRGGGKDGSLGGAYDGIPLQRFRSRVSIQKLMYLLYHEKRTGNRTGVLKRTNYGNLQICEITKKFNDKKRKRKKSASFVRQKPTKKEGSGFSTSKHNNSDLAISTTQKNKRSKFRPMYQLRPSK